MNEIIITNENFDKEVLQSDIPVIIDFWATWCGPCKMLSPIIEEIAKEANGEYKVGKINIDEQPELANAFQIASIPTIVVMENGKVKNSAVGYMPKQDILDLLHR
ncbi:MAG: thioredoxin [Clostridia bacterium]|nr:thioredoxin [Clostridia bacterium]